jgi:hypothetical protein
MGVKGWREIARDNRDASKLILKETKVLHGPYSQWRETETDKESEFLPCTKNRSKQTVQWFLTFNSRGGHLYFNAYFM